MVEPIITNEDARHFWQACRERRFELQRCQACGKHRYPPRRVCPYCLGRQFEWVESRGHGVVYTFTVVERGPSAAFQKMSPYVVALVDLDEGVRIMTNIVGCRPDDVSIGMSVTADFEDVDGFTLHRFRPNSPSA